ncbi:MAG: hypothetical protein LBP59_04590 [Planctomycetaceae bacterium]|jgi:hypothetical protein|nr:hypothetical protein [Planctomycetaceae bacterium]
MKKFHWTLVLVLVVLFQVLFQGSFLVFGDVTNSTKKSKNNTAKKSSAPTNAGQNKLAQLNNNNTTLIANGNFNDNNVENIPELVSPANSDIVKNINDGDVLYLNPETNELQRTNPLAQNKRPVKRNNNNPNTYRSGFRSLPFIRNFDIGCNPDYAEINGGNIKQKNNNVKQKPKINQYQNLNTDLNQGLNPNLGPEFNPELNPELNPDFNINPYPYPPIEITKEFRDYNYYPSTLPQRRRLSGLFDPIREIVSGITDLAIPDSNSYTPDYWGDNPRSLHYPVTADPPAYYSYKNRIHPHIYPLTPADRFYEEQDTFLLGVNGTFVGKEGVLIDGEGIPIGTRLSSDGVLLASDGSQLGVRFGKRCRLLRSDNGQQIPNIGFQLSRDGRLSMRNGTALGTAGFTLGRRGMLLAPNGTPTGISLNNSGTLLGFDGEPLGTNSYQAVAGGVLLGTDGIPIGYRLLPDGSIIRFDGVPILSNSFRRGRNGIILTPDGTPIGPSGIRLNQNGVLISPDGFPIGANVISLSNTYPDDEDSQVASNGRSRGVSGFLRLGDKNEILSPDGRRTGLILGKDGVLTSLSGRSLGLRISDDGILQGTDGKTTRSSNIPNGILLGTDGSPTGLRLAEDGSSLVSPTGSRLGLKLGRDGALLTMDNKPVGSSALNFRVGANNPLRIGRNNIVLDIHGRNTGLKIRRDGVLLDATGQQIGLKISDNGVLQGIDGQPTQVKNIAGGILLGTNRAPTGLTLGKDGETLISPSGVPLGIKLGADGSLIGKNNQKLGAEALSFVPGSNIPLRIGDNNAILDLEGKDTGLKVNRNGILISTATNRPIGARISLNGILHGSDNNPVATKSEADGGGYRTNAAGELLGMNGEPIGLKFAADKKTLLCPNGRSLGLKLGRNGTLLGTDDLPIGTEGLSFLSTPNNPLRVGKNNLVLDSEGKNTGLRIGRNGMLLDATGRSLGVVISRDGFLESAEGNRLSLNDVVDAALAIDSRAVGVGVNFSVSPDGTVFGANGRPTGIRLGNDGLMLSPNGTPLGLFVAGNGVLYSPEGLPVGSIARQTNRARRAAGRAAGQNGTPYLPAEPPVNNIRRDRNNRILGANGTRTRLQLGNNNSLFGVNGEPLGFFVGQNGELLDHSGVPMLANGFRTNDNGVLLDAGGYPLGIKLGDNGTLLGLDGASLGVQLGQNGTLVTPDGFPIVEPVTQLPQNNGNGNDNGNDNIVSLQSYPPYPSYPPNLPYPPAGFAGSPYSPYPPNLPYPPAGFAGSPYPPYPPNQFPGGGMYDPYSPYPPNGVISNVSSGTGRVLTSLRNVRNGIRTLIAAPDYMTGEPAPIPETYSTRGPRDFLLQNPPKIGP